MMLHARNRSLREEVYKAYITRASSGDHDNTDIITQILKSRLQKAKLLGYNNYAEVWESIKPKFSICGFYLEQLMRSRYLFYWLLYTLLIFYR